MNFSISVKDLKYAVKATKNAVDLKAELPSHRGVKIECNEGEALFTSFSPACVVAQAKVKIDSVSTGIVIVDSSALLSAVVGFKDFSKGKGTKDIVISLSKNGKRLNMKTSTIYTSGEEVPQRRSLPITDLKDFPAFNRLNAKKYKNSINRDDLSQGIMSVAYATSSDVTNAIYSGTYIAIKDGVLIFTGTDGICLAEFKTPVKEGSEEIEGIIPRKLSNLICRAFAEEEEEQLSLSITNSHLYIKSSKLVMGGPLVSDDYPDYSGFLVEPKTNAYVSRSVIFDNLSNLNYESLNTDDSRVTLAFMSGTVSVKCMDSMNSNILVEGYQGDFSFDSNLRMLSSSIKGVGGKKLKIAFSESSSPVFFYNTAINDRGGSITCLLVPLIG